MKRFVSIFGALAILFLGSQAMAAPARVPTNLCYFGAGSTNQLLIKSQGTLKTSDGIAKQYGIFGYANTGFDTPVQGSAYVPPGTTSLHGTLTASYAVSGVVRDVRMEFIFDLATQTGTASLWLQTSSGTNTVLNGAMTVVDCKGLALPAFVAGQMQFADQ